MPAAKDKLAELNYEESALLIQVLSATIVQDAMHDLEHLSAVREKMLERVLTKLGCYE
jgi:hypothetical protein